MRFWRIVSVEFLSLDLPLEYFTVKPLNLQWKSVQNSKVSKTVSVKQSIAGTCKGLKKTNANPRKNEFEFQIKGNWN